MRTIDDWLEEYNESHRNPVNKTLHWICVPLIMLSLLGLLWPLGIDFGKMELAVDLNLAMVLIVFALVYYSLLSLPLTLGMLFVSAAILYLLHLLDSLSTPLWIICVAVFVVSWIGQFIGHHVEGKKPSFFKDVQFLLIGPLWLLSFVYRKLGIPY